MSERRSRVLCPLPTFETTERAESGVSRAVHDGTLSGPGGMRLIFRRIPECQGPNKTSVEPIRFTELLEQFREPRIFAHVLILGIIQFPRSHDFMVDQVFG
jgi:hypothetical protein